MANDASPTDLVLIDEKLYRWLEGKLQKARHIAGQGSVSRYVVGSFHEDYPSSPLLLVRIEQDELPRAKLSKQGYVAGQADCRVYDCVVDRQYDSQKRKYTTTYKYVKRKNLTQRVYNYTNRSFSKGTFLLAIRDAYGRYIALSDYCPCVLSEGD